MLSTVSGPNGPMNIKTKMYFDHGNSRTDMNMSDAQGGGLPPAAISQAQAFGMDQVVTINPASKTNVFLIYPKIKAYLSMPVPASATASNNVQITKIGNDTVGGHPCTENKVVVTVDGQPQEFTVWNATDMNNFPVKITVAEQGMSVSMMFESISFNAINSSLFQPPTGDKQYNSIQDLIQGVVASYGGGGVPAPAPPPGGP